MQQEKYIASNFLITNNKIKSIFIISYILNEYSPRSCQMYLKFLVLLSHLLEYMCRNSFVHSWLYASAGTLFPEIDRSMPFCRLSLAPAQQFDMVLPVLQHSRWWLHQFHDDRIYRFVSIKKNLNNVFTFTKSHANT